MTHNHRIGTRKTSVSSHRWQNDRKLSNEEIENNWQNQAMQYRAERDALLRERETMNETIKRLGFRLGQAEHTITQFHTAVGFRRAIDEKQPTWNPGQKQEPEY